MYKFYIVDAFTDTLFGGNPAGVVLIPQGEDFPSDEFMLKTAAELRYSETVFVKTFFSEALSFHLRYFTPAAEVDLCGHATIATFSALYQDGLLDKTNDDSASAYNCKTLAGDLIISVDKGFVMMEMGEPKVLGEIREPSAIERLYKVMGQSDAPTDLPIKMVSTGLPDIILPVASREELNRLAPDFPALAKLSEEYAVTGVHAFALNPSGPTAYCRNFAPLYEIDEEAATGTSSGALTYYLYSRGLLPADNRCRFLQGEAMGRPSIIETELRIEKECV